MPPRGATAASTLADGLARQAVLELAYVKRMERLFRKRQVKPSDMLRVYASTYLTFYTHTERVIETLFIGLLTGRVVLTVQRARPLLQVPSLPVARAVINGTRSYSDWLPYEQHTLKRAAAFFAAGSPFKNLTPADKRALEEASVIRNAIAHGSDHALQRFQQQFTRDRFTKAFLVPPQQRRPAGYLRGAHAGGQTRLDYRMAEVVAVVERLCA